MSGESPTATKTPWLAAVLLGLLSNCAARADNLFVANPMSGIIGEYTASGTTVNASLISGLGDGPVGIALSGSDLFVVNEGFGTIGEYTTSGSTVNASLISGLSNPFAIAIAATTVSAPEPPTSLMLLIGLLGLLSLSALA